jgi:hypothetical protein
MKEIIKKLIPFAIAIVVFIVAAILYFSPVLEGKKIQQSDITQFIGSSKEIADYRKQTGEEPYWTNATFGGMPTYAVSTYYPADYIRYIDKLLRFLPRPADYLFLYFFGFFVLLSVLKIEWKLAILGALGFGFSTYLIVILGVGHNAKAHAIAYMPLVLSGILLVFNKQFLVGFLLTVLAMALEISASHIQMTYYLLFVVLIFGAFKLIEAYKEQQLAHFVKSIAVLCVAVIIAIGINATPLMATQEYAEFSTRGKSELTITPNGEPVEISSGLSKEYITEYSYGLAETFNLFIPRFMGGTRYENVEDSELQRFLQSAVNKGLDPGDANYLMQLSSMYWGEQPIVAAPAYIGAIFVFLFVLGIFLVKGTLKKWLVATTIFAIILSWGKNFPAVTNFFIDYVPLYNKFRAVTSIQVIAELAVPLLGILTLKNFVSNKIDKHLKFEALKWATIIIGGLALIFTVAGTGLFSFETPLDIQIDEQVNGYLDAISADRKSLFFNDSLRTLLFIASFSLVSWLFLKNKLKELTYLVVFGALILLDLVNVNKRYVNNSFFKSARNVDIPFIATAADTEILKDKSYYRVLDLTKNAIADGSTSYFHKSIGGYHAAKPRRYQELYDFHIAKGNMQVLNMLNTKYLIGSNEKGERFVQLNSAANGNAWLIQNLKVVDSANEEILALDSLDTKSVAVINARDVSEKFITSFKKDSTAQISLTLYKPNELHYAFGALENQFVVFSEIYYKNGWNAYINGELVPHYNVNYVLRGLPIRAGEHEIIFKFEPEVIKTGSTITLISYVMFLLIIVGWFLFIRRRDAH